MTHPPTAPLAEIMDQVAKVADTVLFEGYLLYPYRASAQKNQLRWQFGVLTPQDWAQRHSETWYSHTECLLEPDRGPDDTVRTVLRVRLRFLRLRRRRVQRADGPDRFVDVTELTVGDDLYLAWDEGIPAVVDTVLPVADLLAGEVTVPVELPAETTEEALTNGTGRVAGRVLRESWPIRAAITASAEPVPGPYGAVQLRLRVTNLGDAADEHGAGTDAGTDGAQPDRDTALQSSLIGAHSILALSDGQFLSMTDPPEWARPASAACANEHTWPVLAGPPERPRLVLSSPIILADFPEIAPESPNEMFDGTENDEILTLRTMVLTDAEKREARATDPRAAALVDAVDSMPPEIFERLHGVIRSMSIPAQGIAGAGPTPFSTADEIPTYSMETGGKPWWDPAQDASVDPDTDSVLIGGQPVAKGSRVVLRPSGHADAQDLFLDGMPALVEAVLNDVDGHVHLAVSLLDDPASEFQASHGRFRYFSPEEVEVAG
ncbi:hypothetical protein ACTXG6_14310 [Pseudonocardia sp. Cha107L01]|uniref:hypothetical protein n=1 Tax=Pseudonocardia sp. Cha107L01 TaxID=3457576 RepID=UPI00403EDC47